MKNEKGITLIALVVTIVVLIILAGVSISMLTGENGIIKQAQNAKIQTEIAQEKEELAIAYNGASAEKNGGDVNGEDMNKQFNKNGTKAVARGSRRITVKFTESGRTYIIDSKGNISESTDAEEYQIAATMTELYKYYIEGDTENGYKLKNNGEDVISIENDIEMNYLSEYTNSNNQTENVTFVLINDIDLNKGITIEKDGTISGGTPKNWNSIGTEESSFKGNIDGQGYSIKGMYNQGKGMIGYLENGNIENITLNNNYLDGIENSGILIGEIKGEYSEIKNIISKDNYIIEGDRYIGGIIGGIYEGSTECENLYANNTISLIYGYSGYGTGGIVGYVEGKENNFYNCSNEGDIKQLDREDWAEGIGGIIGAIESKNSIIENCYNTGNIDAGGSNGGIVGDCFCVDITIRNSYNTGEIGGNWATGGIIGFDVSGNSTKIYNCYNLGKIYSNDYLGSSIGGIIGQSRSDVLELSGCYNKGEIYASEEFANQGGFIGGLIGQSNDGKLYNCYNWGKINLFITLEHRVDEREQGIGGLIGQMGHTFDNSVYSVINCFSICDVELNYTGDTNPEKMSYFGNIAGVAKGKFIIENCYGFSNKSINLPNDVCKFSQVVGFIGKSNMEEGEEIRELNGYNNLQDEYPVINEKIEMTKENVQDIEDFKSQEFCDILNEWVETNNSDGKYSKWKYNSDQNEGYPYLEN